MHLRQTVWNTVALLYVRPKCVMLHVVCDSATAPTRPFMSYKEISNLAFAFTFALISLAFALCGSAWARSSRRGGSCANVRASPSTHPHLIDGLSTQIELSQLAVQRYLASAFPRPSPLLTNLDRACSCCSCCLEHWGLVSCIPQKPATAHPSSPEESQAERDVPPRACDQKYSLTFRILNP
jgi:hypothetical protein